MRERNWCTDCVQYHFLKLNFKNIAGCVSVGMCLAIDVTYTNLAF